jgi:hypothetical protein
MRDLVESYSGRKDENRGEKVLGRSECSKQELLLLLTSGRLGE